MAIDLGTLNRINAVSIFADDPTARGRVLAFLLENAAIPDRQRVRLDTTGSGTVRRGYSVARSPLERATADAVRRDPISISITGTLSASPLGPAGRVLGLGSSFVRRDLRERDKLAKLADTREPVVVVAPWIIAGSMAITGLDEGQGNGEKVDLTISLEELRVVDPLTVSGSIDLDALLAGAPESLELGPQPLEAVTAPAELAGGGLGV